MNNISNTVHGLWVKGKLSPLELLTIQTYLSCGYDFKLWTYDAASLINLPEHVTINDANEIIAEKDVFVYNQTNQFGHGKGSYAGFSDIFRYKLLYEKGGWWTDMDVSCLKRLRFNGEYVFRFSKEREDTVVGNIMHVPPGSELMKWCYEEAVKVVHADSRDWMAPIQILNEAIDKFELREFVYHFSNSDSWPVVSRFIAGNAQPEEHWFAIHWMNEEFRRLKVPKEKYLKISYLGSLYHKHGIAEPLKGILEKWAYKFKVSRLYYAFLHFRRETIWQSIYYLGHNLFYAISDLYFVKIKPKYDLGKFFRREKS